MPTVEEYAGSVIAEVRRDQMSGVIPVTVRTFTELHDYVDANEYVIDVLAGVQLSGPAYYELSDSVTDRADGMLREVNLYRCPCCGDDVMDTARYVAIVSGPAVRVRMIRSVSPVIGCAAGPTSTRTASSPVRATVQPSPGRAAP